MELGSGDSRGQTTFVPLNGAFILAEDQIGVGAQFGASKNYFDYSGGKNTIASTSENFVTAAGNFSTAEQGSLVSQQLTGVCNSSGGCSGSFSLNTSVFSYRLYPLAVRDHSESQSFIIYPSGGSVLTRTPAKYWMRSNNDLTGVGWGQYVEAETGVGGTDTVTTANGFRPAGVLNLDGAQCLLTANISLRKLFKLENADK